MVSACVGMGRWVGHDKIMSIVGIVIVVVIIIIISSGGGGGGGGDCLKWEVAGDHRIQQHAERPDIRLHGGEMRW